MPFGYDRATSSPSIILPELGLAPAMAANVGKRSIVDECVVFHTGFPV